MTKNFYYIIITVLLFAACRISKIRSNLYYHNAGMGWPTVILYKDSTFAFNYLVPNKFEYTSPPLFPEKYFITKGRWELKRGIIILTSSSDSLAHSIELSHSIINPFVRKSTDPSYSKFVFSDIWGDTVRINRVIIKNNGIQTNVDTLEKQYNVDMSSEAGVMIFYFENYDAYTFKKPEKVNMDYDITLQPKYSTNFFQSDTFKIIRMKFIDLKRKLSLVK